MQISLRSVFSDSQGTLRAYNITESSLWTSVTILYDHVYKERLNKVYKIQNSGKRVSCFLHAPTESTQLCMELGDL